MFEVRLWSLLQLGLVSYKVSGVSSTGGNYNAGMIEKENTTLE